MSHSYEEIRSAAIDALAGRVNIVYDVNQFAHLKIAVAKVLEARGLQSTVPYSMYGADPKLSSEDANICLEVFWDLFRQGIITLGLDDSNPEFPFFRLSSLGERILKNENNYFTHDVSAYEARIKREVSQIDEVTLLYLKEALQAFRSECILSSTVMLGVATEHTFLLLLDKISKNSTHQPTFSSVVKERTILHKVNKFRKVLEGELHSLPPEIKEDLDTNFSGVLSIIRNFRNESGHPTGKIIDREQAYVLLQLFIPYCKKMYQLIAHYS
jgi:hypothetical protein